MREHGPGLVSGILPAHIFFFTHFLLCPANKLVYYYALPGFEPRRCGMRSRVPAALALFLLVLALVAIGTGTRADQNNPWNVAKGSDRPTGPTADAEPKQSLYASVGPLLTQ